MILFSSLLLLVVSAFVLPAAVRGQSSNTQACNYYEDSKIESFECTLDEYCSAYQESNNADEGRCTGSLRGQHENSPLPGTTFAMTLILVCVLRNRRLQKRMDIHS